MPKPVCVKCQRFFKPFRNRTPMLEQMSRVSKAAPGAEHPEQWEPYKLWVADLWRCDGCGSEIVVGYGAEPVGEHFQPSFDAALERARARGLVTVNDC
jgi:hypothetical protein